MMLQAMISTCSLLGLLDSNLSESISISVGGCGARLLLTAEITNHNQTMFNIVYCQKLSQFWNGL